MTRGIYSFFLSLAVGLNPVWVAAEERPAVPGSETEEQVSEENPAGETSSSPDPEYEVVITARRSAQRAFEAPRSVGVVDRQDFLRLQSRAVPEALRETTGVLVQETNRGAGAPILRGLIGPQNLILVDGVRFNTSTFRTGPNQYLATLNPFAIRRLEVVRGPSSVLYGNGAMGGVMQVLTTDPRAVSGHSLEASGWVQSADQARGGRLELMDWVGDVGFLVGGSATGFGTLRAGEGRRQPVSDYATGSWNGKVVYFPLPSLKLTGAYFGTVLRDAGRTDRLGQGDVRLYDNDDHLAYVRADWVGEQAREQVTGTVSFHRTYERVDRFSCENDDSIVVDKRACASLEESAITRKRIFQDDVQVVGLDINARTSWLDRRLTVRGGAEGYFDSVDSSLRDARASEDFGFEKRDRGNFSNDSTYRTLGAFLHVEGTPVDLGPDRGRLVLTAGGRLSNFRARAPGVPGLGDVEYDFTGLVGTAGLQAFIYEFAHVYASFVQGFRAPNLQETTVLADTGSKFEIPNADLKPERSDTFEVGTKVDAGPVSANVAWFRSNIRNAIDEREAQFEGQSEVEGKPVIQRVNTAKGVYTGVEGSLSATWWRLTATGGMTWTQGDLTDGDGTENPARRVPPVFGTAGVRYVPPDRQGYVELFVNWAARQDRLNPSDERDLRICETDLHSGRLRETCQGTPGWATVNARAGWRFSQALSLDLAVLNLTDERYRVHGSGFEAAGLDGRATLTVRY